MSIFVIDISVEMYIDCDEIVCFSISDHQMFNRIKAVYYNVKGR